MAGRFIRDPEIVAGPAPLRAMRRDPTPAGAELGEQMRQLVAQRAIDLGGVVFAQPRVQGNEITMRIGAPRCAEKSSVPFHADFVREICRVERSQDFTSFRFQGGIASEDDERGPCWESEI